jgi:hypothetical protein
MKAVKASGKFWYDFLIGDDWKIAVAVAAALVIVGIADALGLLTGTALPIVGALLLFALFALSVVIDVYAGARRNNP